MNSLFNYELDERQIRLTLHDAELGYNEASWNEFDAAHPGHVNTGTKLSQFNLPNIHLNINRSVLVPLFFIIALAGVSAIMFRFVDFKANKPVEVEKALIPDASNFKTEQKDPAAPPAEPKKQTAAVVPDVKKDTILAVVNTPPPAATVGMQPTIQNAAKTPVTTSAYKSSAASQKPPVTDSAVNASPAPEKPAGDTIAAASGQTASASEPSVSNKSSDNTYYYYKGKKRRKKVTADQVESLKAPTTLIGSQTADADAEPELRLK
ncbi:MAG: hypothetical protein ACXVP0_02250 [Bacteroidia bacterium]